MKKNLDYKYYINSDGILLRIHLRVKLNESPLVQSMLIDRRHWNSLQSISSLQLQGTTWQEYEDQLLEQGFSHAPDEYLELIDVYS